MQRRPSHKELTKKITESKVALSNKDGLFADPSKVISELMALDIGDTEEAWALIAELLEEIEPTHYVVGGHLTSLTKNPLKD